MDFFIQVNNPFNIILAHMKASAPEANSTDCCFVITRSFHGCVPGVGLSPALATSETSELLVSNVSVMSGQTCADPEIFMRGGPTKMVIFGNRRGGWGGPTPQKSRNYLFLGKIFKFQGGSGPPVPPLDPRMTKPTLSGFNQYCRVNVSCSRTQH